MNPILIAGGITITAKILSFIFNELTEQEKAKQEEILQNTQEYDSKIQKAKENDDADYAVECQRLIDEKYKYLCGQAEERLSYEKKLAKDIKNHICNTNNLLKDNTITTALRRNSLYRLLNQLKEAKERCYGYQNYLRRYLEYIKRHIDNGEDFSPFSMIIPADYPYIGKVVMLKADLLKNGKTLLDDTSVEGIKINYKLTVVENIDFENENMTLPFMVEKYLDKENHYYEVSLDKGMFYTEILTNTHAGAVAKVKEIFKNGIILTYRKSLNLFMRNENLLKPYRKPPIGAEVTIYPLTWEYALPTYKEDKYPVTVSERFDDATGGMFFERFPLVMKRVQWKNLCHEIDQNGIADIEDEWKIGPVDESNIINSEGVELKFQFGDVLLLKARLTKYPIGESNGVLIAEYVEELPLKDCFKCDDIFVNVDVGIHPVIIDDDDYSIIEKYIPYEELQIFIMDLFSELCTQKKIKEAMAGSRFYQIWSDITSKLINYLKKGQKFVVEIEYVERESNNLIVHIDNSETLKNDIEAFERELNKDNHKNLHAQSYITTDTSNCQYMVKISPDFCSLTIYNCNSIDITSSQLIIYAENIPHAEIRQKEAISQFRVGKLLNPSLQSALMDGHNVEPLKPKEVNFELTNKLILNNNAQMEALKKAFCEDNIFFIQGPPGTGKTTVIRELVEQYLKAYLDCRILIVSQANVAVDNALSGIVKSHKDMIIRCGNAEKISRDLQNITLDNYYSRYIQTVHENVSDENSDIYNKWIEFVNPEGGLNPNIGELIIKAYKIVGATCVGLARKRIGLERVRFDLVIIDEAGKALPGEILIPVVRAKKMIMIGDHKQLPPVINPALYDPESIELDNRTIIENNLFEISLFERVFEQAPAANKIMLTQQFRMPAVIGNLISKLFYDSKLQNGIGTELKKPIYSDSSLVMHDFSNDKKYHEDKIQNSIVNYREADYVVELLKKIVQKQKDCSIAVITPYRGQKRLIQNCKLKNKDLNKANIRINTIDAFQGDEAEVVLYCTTRATRTTSYFSDFRRINVALSRAKNELIILGSYKYFMKYEKGPLPELAEYIENNGVIHKVIQSPDWVFSGDNKSTDRIVSLNDISCYETFDCDERVINKHINYYYNHGQMEKPIMVKSWNNKFKVVDNAEIFFACIELHLSECWINIVK
ncbi:MAG: AAA domain-containing protein [bacterium]|nr:AAA domain-containing protein [bacterium]